MKDRRLNARNREKLARMIGLFLSITLLFITCGDDTEVENELKNAPTLTFTKLTVNKKDVTKEQLLQQIKEKEKEGFSIRKITISDSDFAEVKGTAPNLSLTIKKAGTFKITITLRKSGYKDVTIEATIVYIATEALTFDKLSTAKSTLSKDDILKQVKGNKDGFTLKSIAISDAAFAQVQGTAPNLSLTIKKAGDFTATIVLEKTHYNDVTLNAAFSGVPETLTFNELTTYKATLNKQDLFKQIPEAAKVNYALKSIAIDAKYNDIAEVKGTAPNLSLTLKKLGRFKADITLSKTDYLDVAITGASFNYISTSLTFSKFKTDKKTLTKTEIFNQVQGDKTGYTLTKIAVANASDATVNADNSLTLKKDGIFTITLTLQKAGIPDKTVNGQIEYRPKPALTFDKLTSAKKTITQAEIERQIKGNKNGYTLKNIAVADSNFATVTGTAPNFSLTLKKTGTFSVTITLQKANYFDVTLNASFEGKPENLSFDKLSTYKKNIPKADILKQVKGGSGSYTIKSIAVNQSAFATVGSDLSLTILKEGDFTANITLQKTGYFDSVINNAAFKGTSESLNFSTLKTHKNTLTKAEIFAKVEGNKTGYTIIKIAVTDTSYATVNPDNSLTLKKDGIFAITLTLQKAGIPNKTVNGQIEYRPKPTLTFDKLTSAKKIITQAEIITQIKGSKNGYTLKNIVVADSNFASVTGTAPNLSLTLKKTGTFSATLTLGKTNYSDVTLNASIEGKPESLTFDKLTISKKAIPQAEINAQIKGSKNGYTLKNIVVADSNFASVTGTAPNLSLTLKKTGTFSATLTLGKANHFDVTLNASIEGKVESLTFDKLTTSKKAIPQAEINTQIKGSKNGYTLKNIVVADSNFASVTGTAPNLSLTLKKTGTFNATLTLGKANHFDVTLNASIEGRAENLSFNPLSITYAGTSTFNSAAILAQVQGTGKANYTLKSISNISDVSVAQVQGTGGGSRINFKKAGSFTAALVLERNGYFDVTIPAARFALQKGASKNLSFNKLSIDYQKTIGKAQLDSRITGSGSDKAGYAIVRVFDVTPSDIAEPTGLNLHIKKTGDFTAKITLAHNFYGDATLTASFTIRKGDAKNIRFDKLTLPYQKTISKARVEQNLKGEKDGYVIKEITGISDPSVAELSGLNVTLKKLGSFTLSLTLSHPGYKDSTITGCEFDIIRKTSPKLVFTKLVTTNRFITSVDILGQINNSDGYTLKELTGLSDLSGAELSGIGIRILRSGSYTVDVVLSKDYHTDVEITGCEFDIIKKSPPKLDFEFVTYKNKFKKSTLLKEVSGIDLRGYLIKSINNLNPVSGGPNIAEISGSNLKIYKQECEFTVDLVLSHDEYLDTTITGVTFIKEKAFIFNKLTGTISGVTSKYKDYFKNAKSVIFPDRIGLSDTPVIKISGTETPKSGQVVTNVFGTILLGSSGSTPPDGIESPNIEYIKVPKYLSTIGKRAFMGCEKLKKIENYIDSEITELTGSRPMDYTHLTEINGYAFHSCFDLTTFKISMNKVTRIGHDAFAKCTKLPEINIPKSVTHIGDDAFDSCFGIKVLSIGKREAGKTLNIGDRAFNNCTNLDRVKLGSGIKKITTWMFAGCTKLKEVILYDPKFEYIGQNPFYGTSNVVLRIVGVTDSPKNNKFVEQNALDIVKEIRFLKSADKDKVKNYDYWKTSWNSKVKSW